MFTAPSFLLFFCVGKICQGLSNGDPIDLDGAVKRDDKALTTVDDARLDQVGALGLYLDDHVRRLDLKALCLHHVAHEQLCILTGGFLIVLLEVGELFIRDAAVRQDGLYFILVQDQGLRIFLELMFFDHFGQLLVNVLYDLQITGVLQSLLNDGVEGLLLASCREGQGTAENGVHKTVL